MAAKKILFATDFSPASRHALPIAAWLARCTDAQLLIVHVSDAEPYPVGELFNDQPEPDGPERDRLESIRPDDAGVVCEHRLLYGEPGSTEVTKPADILLKLAEHEGVEMIVLGTHGRGGLRHLLMGSVAEAVMRRANCPVVTVREAAPCLTAERQPVQHCHAP